ncbi:DUF2290 domain-containing protein [Proteus mirabilis]|uniref:DUF2290 domain-containing protein n=1 Tax=Proteus mirabilis TaxID=584 RepID=UPI003315426F
MNKKFNQSIRETITLAEQHGLLFQAGASSSLSTPAEVISKTRKATSYKEVYDTLALSQSFNLMMKDKSFFQFTETEPNKEVRLAYYPNPYQFSEYMFEKREALDLLHNKEITDIEYEQLMSEADFTSDIPVIRYDLSFKQHCNLYHPTAHFHIGFHAENRWPVGRLLTPKAFFLKTLYNYYSEKWREQEATDGSTVTNILDSLYRSDLRNECPLVSDLDPKKFERIEEERLHFR